jgi:23S rRNA (uracil1939-C5)-methyltransferase
MAAGGDAIARDDGGRVVFVEGALPGERVLAAVVDERRDFARAHAEEVLEAAPARVAAPCPHVAEGCGGCGWQHVAVGEQGRLKAAIVADALRRIGRLDPPGIALGPELPATGYRTTVRAAVLDGVAGFRHRRSHDVVTVAEGGCLVAHPLVDEVLRSGRFGEAAEVTVRAGVASGERLVVAHPSAGGVEVPDGVAVVGTDELRAGRRAWIHEAVAGRTWRISAQSFFQARPDGAAALVDAVLAAAAVDGTGAVADLYGGVGLFAGAIADRFDAAPVVVERNRSAAADARHNLAGTGAKVLGVPVERWRPSPADLVVADPSRAGLGRAGVARVAATGAGRLVLVSCDAAALARDAALLAGEGFTLAEVTLVDLFPHTAHVEVVARFDRPGSGLARGTESRMVGGAGGRRPEAEFVSGVRCTSETRP